jgi:hypothetical protein
VDEPEDVSFNRGIRTAQRYESNQESFQQSAGTKSQVNGKTYNKTICLKHLSRSPKIFAHLLVGHISITLHHQGKLTLSKQAFLRLNERMEALNKAVSREV